MVVPHAAAAAVPPHGEDLADHHHAAQRAVGELQDLRVADFLQGCENILDVSHHKNKPTKRNQKKKAFPRKPLAATEKEMRI